MDRKTIAIIGAGPRGLSALESFVGALSRKNKQHDFSIVMYDDTPWWGAGPNHAPDLPETNLINLSEREITIDARPVIHLGQLKIDAFPSYHEWTNLTKDPAAVDNYPPRARLGKYLHERFQSISRPLKDGGVLTCFQERATEISFNGDPLVGAGDSKMKFSEVLLCPGHLPVEPDEQMKSWLNQKKSDLLHLQKDAYPIPHYIDMVMNTHHHIAVRGFGLTFLDIIASAATRLGKFTELDGETLELKFEKGADSSHVIYPFSNEGLPPIPKPLSARVFNLFKPEPADMEHFQNALQQGLKEVPEQFMELFIDQMARLSAIVYQKIDPGADLHNVRKSLVRYMQREDYSYPHFMDQGRDTHTIISDYCSIACGEMPATLDYCLGQVWRHCRTFMYDLLWHPPLPDDVLLELIKLDERMKRYTYGPPLISLRKLLALHSAGLVSFQYIDDPKIELNSEGWTIESRGQRLTATCMIDSVLSPPDISKTATPLVQSFLNNLYVRSFDSLGAITTKEALLPDCPGRVALLGRLAKGRVFGTDSIRECFSDEVDAWAEGVVDRCFD